MGLGLGLLSIGCIVKTVITEVKAISCWVLKPKFRAKEKRPAWMLKSTIPPLFIRLVKPKRLSSDRC